MANKSHICNKLYTDKVNRVRNVSYCCFLIVIID